MARKLYIPVNCGLLEPEHIDRMGIAVWLFLWCIDRQTREKDGLGWVYGGKLLTHEEIAEEMGRRERTVRRWCKLLENEDYIVVIHGHQKRMKIGVKKPTKGGLRSSKSGRSDSAKYGRDEDHAEGDSSRPDMDGDNRPSLADKDASERPHVPDSGPDVAGHSLEIDLTPDLKQQPQSSKSDEKKSGHPAPKPRKKGDEDRASSLAAIRAIKEAIEIDIPWTAKHYRILRKYHLPNLTIEQIKDAVLDAEDAIREEAYNKADYIVGNPQRGKKGILGNYEPKKRTTKDGQDDVAGKRSRRRKPDRARSAKILSTRNK